MGDNGWRNTPVSKGCDITPVQELVVYLISKDPISANQNEYQPGHEKMCLMSYANNKGADQPAHSRSLISAFVVRCSDNIISLDSIVEISRL